MKSRTPSIVLFALAITSCGDGTSPAVEPGLDAGTDDGATAALAIDPPNAIVGIFDANTAPADVHYKVTRGGVDVTSSVTLTIDDPALGTFAGATFSPVKTLAALGRSGLVMAKLGAASGVARLSLVRQTSPTTKMVVFQSAPTPPLRVDAVAAIQRADLAFSLDTTGDMGGTVSNIKSSFAGTIFPALAKRFPSAAVAVVEHRDNGDAFVVAPRQVVTIDATKVAQALAALTVGGGGDEPEAQLSSLAYIATGQALGTTPSVATHVPAAGTSGGVDFRAGAFKVVVELSSASFHDPSGASTSFAVATSFKNSALHYIGVVQGGAAIAIASSLSFATNTGSSVKPSAFQGPCAAGLCCTGLSGAAVAPVAGLCPLVFQSALDGTGAASALLGGVDALATSSFDTTLSPTLSETTTPNVDPAALAKVRAVDEGDPALSCAALPAIDAGKPDGIKETFTALAQSSHVCFDLVPAAVAPIAPTSNVQVVAVTYILEASDGTTLSTPVTVLFVVPPIPL